MEGPEKDHWEVVNNEDLDKIECNSTCMPTTLPPGATVIPYQIVFYRKFDEQGHVVLLKASLVAKGYVEKCWVGYDETFAPVLSFSVLLLVHGRYVRMRWHVHHAGVSAALLYREVDGDVYGEWDNMTYNVNHSLYVLNHSPARDMMS